LSVGIEFAPRGGTRPTAGAGPVPHRATKQRQQPDAPDSQSGACDVASPDRFDVAFRLWAACRPKDRPDKDICS